VEAADRSIRIVVDGQLFDVAMHPDLPGQYDFTWVSGPIAGYGFSSRTSDHRPMTDTEIEQAIQNFLGQVDPNTGHIG
jgi:hypothetical protein